MNKKNIIIASLALIILILAIIMWQDSNKSREALLDSNNNDSAIQKPINGDDTGSQNPIDKPPVSSNPDDGMDVEAEMAGKSWVLYGIEKDGKDMDMSAKVSKPISLEFKSSDKSYSGFGGCNGFGGNYKFTSSNNITFEPPISTKIYCQGGASELEQQYLQLLSEVKTVWFKGDSLVLIKDDLNLIKFSPSK